MEKVKIDSPRGPWTMSKAHNPIQDIYLRRVEGNANQVIGVAWKALDDPARGCKMSAALALVRTLFKRGQSSPLLFCAGMRRCETRMDGPMPWNG